MSRLFIASRAPTFYCQSGSDFRVTLICDLMNKGGYYSFAQDFDADIAAPDYPGYPAVFYAPIFSVIK
jgi:hypothetical protein